MRADARVLTALRSRRSVGMLVEPGPTADEIATMLECAEEAPDHGRLRPWSFRVFTGPAKHELGAVLLDAFRHRCERDEVPVTDQELEAERNKVARAPVLIVVCARPQPGRIPEVEQIAAVAAATQNLLIAAGALGYGTKWRTGSAAYDGEVKAFLGLDEPDHVIGFVSIGTVPARA